MTMVSNQIDNGFDAGFTRSWNPSSARRQFQMSLILVGALLCSAVVLASTLRFDPPMQEGRSASINRSYDKSSTISPSFAGSIAPLR